MVDDINVYSKKLGTGRYYPVVRIPKSINDILEKYPYYYRPKPVPPISPIQPSLYGIHITRKAFDTWLNSLSKDDSDIFKLHANTKSFNIMDGLDIDKTPSFKNYCWFLGIAVFFILMYINMEFPVLVYGALVLVVLVSIVWIPIIIMPIKKEEKYNNELSKKRLSQYVADLKDYVMRFETYKMAWDKYGKELNEYNHAIQNKIENPEIYKKRQDAYKNVNKTIRIKELTYDEISAVKKGRAECYFYNKMLDYYMLFPFDIYVNVKIESAQDNGNVYFPDFLLCSDDGKIKKIYYDIEIDEPYVQSTGEPIHCEGMDYSRDDFFSNNDVVVIRFAESQIFKNPYKCVQYIIDLHKNITSMTSWPKLVRCGFKVERWSKELSIEWSKIHYRDTYAPSMSYYDHYNITYNNDNWRLISASQLDEKSIEAISEIKAVKWYSKKCLLINMKSGEQRYIDINPMNSFNEGETVGTYDIWIETYTNKNNERMFLVGHYPDETYENTLIKNGIAHAVE